MRPLYLLVVLSLFLLPHLAYAASLTVVGGELIGASDVDVAGTPYDVSFVDGTCVALFDGCDGPGDFAFASSTEALSAAQALLDQVFVGAFDADPELTAGCEDTSFCIPDTPFAGDGLVFSGARAQNASSEGSDASYIQTGSPATVDFGVAPANNFAIWTPVPEPSTALLFAAGLSGLALSRRRDQATARLPQSRRPTRRCS